MLEAKRKQAGVPADPVKLNFPEAFYPNLTAVIPEPTPEEREYREQRNRVEIERLAAIDYQRSLEACFGREGRYLDCSFDNFNARTDREQFVVSALHDYCLDGAHENGEGILFYGSCGNGKDHLAIAVVRECIKAGASCKAINGCDWYGELRDQMDADRPRSERDIIEELTKPMLLLISDPLPPIGDLTQFQAVMLYRLIDARYRMFQATIVTVNVKDGAEAERRMGVAIWDRLKDGAWVVPCDWPSYRKPVRIVRKEKP